MKAFVLTEYLLNRPHAEVRVSDAFGNKVECVANIEDGQIVIRPIFQPSKTDPLTLNAYQEYAWAEAIYPGHGHGTTQSVTIALAGLVGETGRALQCHHDVMWEHAPMSADVRTQLGIGLAHALWYLAATTKELGMTLSELGRQSIMQSRAWRRQHQNEAEQSSLEVKQGRAAAEPN